MKQTHRLSRYRLSVLLLAFLALFGCLPLLVQALSGTIRNQGVFARQEQEKLTRNIELLRQDAVGDLAAVRRQLAQVTEGMGAIPTDGSVSETAAQNWIASYLRSFQDTTANHFATRIVDLINGRAQRSTVPEIQAVMDQALDRVLGGEELPYALVPRGLDEDPLVVVTEVVRKPGGREPAYVLQATVPLPIRRNHLDEVYLIDLRARGRVVWATNTEADLVWRAIQQSAVVKSFLALPRDHDIIPVLEYPLRIGAKVTPMIGQATRLGVTGWGLVVQQRSADAFVELRRLIKDSLITLLVMLLLAVALGAVASRLITKPIERLAQTTHAIAHGQFGERVEPVGFGSELADLAASFNRMSAQIRDHVERLRHAAQLNRDLFIGSIRALLAAIEAKEPYTRGHTERVASYSQAVARHLNLTREFQERVWIAGLLHDVGKIGIEDRVLKKGDRLTDEEYAEMKRHPVIGAEIMASIDLLKDTLPAIRWHHEDWDGSGYPDRLRGEEIPLMARIVAVADTFDAITTQRVYQNPYTNEQALAIITKLIGKRFDPQVANAFLAANAAGDIRAAQPAVEAELRAVAPTEVVGAHS